MPGRIAVFPSAVQQTACLHPTFCASATHTPFPLVHPTLSWSQPKNFVVDFQCCKNKRLRASEIAVKIWRDFWKRLYANKLLTITDPAMDAQLSGNTPRRTRQAQQESPEDPVQAHITGVYCPAATRPTGAQAGMVNVMPKLHMCAGTRRTIPFMRLHEPLDCRPPARRRCPRRAGVCQGLSFS